MYCKMLSCVLGPYPLDASSMPSQVVKANIAGHLQMSPDEPNHLILDNNCFRAGFLTTWHQLPPEHTWELVRNAGFQGHPQVCQGACVLPCTTGSSGDFKG